MELHEVIQQIRREKNLKIKTIHDKIIQVFGDKGVSYRTLLRVLQGHTDGRDASLYQLCVGMGITLNQLKENQTREPDILPSLEYIKRKERRNAYIYNESAKAEIISGDKRSFLALEMILKPKGKTRIEKDLPEHKGEKFIYVVRGRLTIYLEDKKFVLKNGDSLSFDSTMAHSLENNARQRTFCLIIKSPRIL